MTVMTAPAQLTRPAAVTGVSAQIGYALSAIACLLLGIFITPFLSSHFEQRVFSLIIFSALQLLPLVFALRLPSALFVRGHLFCVAMYFLLASLANFFFPFWKQHLALMFYGFFLLIVLLACVAGGSAIYATLQRLIRRTS